MQLSFSSRHFSPIDVVVTSFVERGIIAGAVTIVARKGEILHLSAQGHMDLETDRAMRPDTIFRLASLTKPVVGAAILMLFEEGKLLLTDPVSAFLPMFKDLQVADGNGFIPALREITLRDLLTHTSGLGSGPNPPTLVDVPGGLGANDTLADVVPRMASVPLRFQPGTTFRYSPEHGFDVLGRVVEIASGQNLDEFVRQRIFEPLGARDIFFHVPARRLPDVATPYERTPNGLSPAIPSGMLALSTVPDSGYHSGSGGLAGTAESYLRFAMLLAQGGEFEGQRVLSKRTVALMASNHVGKLPLQSIVMDLRGYRFGLGVRVLDNPAEAGSRARSGGRAHSAPSYGSIRSSRWSRFFLSSACWT